MTTYVFLISTNTVDNIFEIYKIGRYYIKLMGHLERVCDTFPTKRQFELGVLEYFNKACDMRRDHELQKACVSQDITLFSSRVIACEVLTSQKHLTPPIPQNGKKTMEK